MANTTAQDLQLTRQNSLLVVFQDDKSKLENVGNPNSDITNTINILEKKIQRCKTHITNITAQKAAIIKKFNDNAERHISLGETYGEDICNTIEKYT